MQSKTATSLFSACYIILDAEAHYDSLSSRRICSPELLLLGIRQVHVHFPDTRLVPIQERALDVFPFDKSHNTSLFDSIESVIARKRKLDSRMCDIVCAKPVWKDCPGVEVRYSIHKLKGIS